MIFQKVFIELLLISINYLSNSRKFKYNQNCIVESVISNTILLTKKPCLTLSQFLGFYFIGRENSNIKNTTPPLHPFPILNSNSIFNLHIKKQFKDLIESKMDFYTFETVSVSKNDKEFYSQNYLFHPGLILKAPNFSVFQFQITKR